MSCEVKNIQPKEVKISAEEYKLLKLKSKFIYYYFGNEVKLCPKCKNSLMREGCICPECGFDGNGISFDYCEFEIEDCEFDYE